ncbi:helix-turn-helix transcriptional regulator, partial [Bifidobacterium longum]
MVRNDRLKKTGESTKLIAEFVEERRRAKSLTQKQIASALGEKTSQSYVSVRLRGKAAWTMDDLDAIAPLIDFDNAIELIGNLARKRATEENEPGLLARQFVAIMDGDNVV